MQLFLLIELGFSNILAGLASYCDPSNFCLQVAKIIVVNHWKFFKNSFKNQYLFVRLTSFVNLAYYAVVQRQL
jgi:hypothetical protein